MQKWIMEDPGYRQRALIVLKAEDLEGFRLYASEYA